MKIKTYLKTPPSFFVVSDNEGSFGTDKLDGLGNVDSLGLFSFPSGGGYTPRNLTYIPRMMCFFMYLLSNMAIWGTVSMLVFGGVNLPEFFGHCRSGRCFFASVHHLVGLKKKTTSSPNGGEFHGDESHNRIRKKSLTKQAKDKEIITKMYWRWKFKI